MKTLKLIGLLVLATTLCSCPNPEEWDIECNIHLSFQDASGNDLVKELKEGDTEGGSLVSTALYSMEVIFPDGSIRREVGESNTVWLFVHEANPFPNYKLFGYPNEINRSYNYLYFNIADSKPIEKLTFRLRIPRVFGDDVRHEMVVWCKKSDNDKKYGQYYTCYRLELDGKEIKTFENSLGTSVAAMVVLDQNQLQ